eukprot:jgi/Botrbrau1/11940/Bobra.341_1s0007.1
MGKKGEKRKTQRDDHEAGSGEEAPVVKLKKPKAKKEKPSREENGEEPQYNVEFGFLGALTEDDKKSSARHFDLVKGGQGVLLGCRIPKDYFLCTGAGDTNDGGGMDPWETGSYDLALEQAGIEDFNIVPYTSVIPAESTEVLLQSAKPSFHHGAVLECIMAKMNGSQGDRITAGVGMMKVRRKSDNHVYGGWAAEYAGHASEAGAQKTLESDLTAMFERRFKDRNGGLDDHEMMDVKYTISSIEVEKQFGTCFAAICFCSYIHPLASPTTIVGVNEA